MALFTFFGRNIFHSAIEVAPKMSSIMCSKTLATCSVAHKKKSLAEELGLPDAPTPPLRPFLKYINTGHKELPHLSWMERVRKLSENWNSQTDQQKQERLDEYYEDKKTYQVHYSAYLKQLSPSQVSQLSLAVSQRQRLKAAKNLRLNRKKLLEQHGRPKMPESCFILFLRTREQERGQSRKELVMSASGAWRDLSASDRQQFLQLAEHNRQKYFASLEVWEERMVAEGRGDLVRKKSPHLAKLSNKNVRQADADTAIASHRNVGTCDQADNERSVTGNKIPVTDKKVSVTDNKRSVADKMSYETDNTSSHRDNRSSTDNSSSLSDMRSVADPTLDVINNNPTTFNCNIAGSISESDDAKVTVASAAFAAPITASAASVTASEADASAAPPESPPLFYPNATPNNILRSSNRLFHAVSKNDRKV